MTNYWSSSITLFSQTSQHWTCSHSNGNRNIQTQRDLICLSKQWMHQHLLGSIKYFGKFNYIFGLFWILTLRGFCFYRNYWGVSSIEIHRSYSMYQANSKPQQVRIYNVNWSLQWLDRCYVNKSSKIYQEILIM